MSIIFSQMLESFLNEGESFENILFASDKGEPPELSYQVNFPRLELVSSGHYLNQIWSPEGDIQSVQMGQREVMYIPPNGWNKPIWDNDCSVLSLLFGKRHIGFSLVNKRKGDLDFCNVQKHSIQSGAGRALDHILLSLNTLAQEQVRAPMDNHLLQALLSYALQLLVESESGRRRGSNLFHGICIYIQENFHRVISRESIAARFNISPSHLSRLFRQQGHMRLADYISWVRIDRAKFMLKKYRFRLEEVANRCGYSDVNYFCRVFKEKTGLTPTEYRSLSQPQSQTH